MNMKNEFLEILDRMGPDVSEDFLKDLRQTASLGELRVALEVLGEYNMEFGPCLDSVSIERLLGMAQTIGLDEKYRSMLSNPPEDPADFLKHPQSPPA